MNDTGIKIKESVCANCFKVFEIIKENINNYRCPVCMSGHAWKQWKGFKKLHAIKKYKGGYISICGLYFFGDPDIFVEPITADIECKNCKRELNKALMIEIIDKEYGNRRLF